MLRSRVNAILRLGEVLDHMSVSPQGICVGEITQPRQQVLPLASPGSHRAAQTSWRTQASGRRSWACHVGSAMQALPLLPWEAGAGGAAAVPCVCGQEPCAMRTTREGSLLLPVRVSAGEAGAACPPPTGTAHRALQAPLACSCSSAHLGPCPFFKQEHHPC